MSWYLCPRLFLLGKRPMITLVCACKPGGTDAGRKHADPDHGWAKGMKLKSYFPVELCLISLCHAFSHKVRETGVKARLSLWV